MCVSELPYNTVLHVNSGWPGSLCSGTSVLISLRGVNWLARLRVQGPA